MNTIKVNDLSAFTPVVSRRVQPIVSLPDINPKIIKKTEEYNKKKHAYAFIKKLFGTSSDNKLK